MPRRSLSETPEDARLHLERFIEFAYRDSEAGGPDHHLACAVAMAQKDTNDPYEIAWRIGCYIGPYNEPAGEAIWHEWSYRRVRDHPEAFAEWFTENWKGIPLRRERIRPMGSPNRMLKFFESYHNEVPFLVDAGQDLSYEELWDELENIIYAGRYTGMKLLESLRRAGITKAAQPDIRADGGWSPRLALSYLLPEHDELLNRNSKKAASNRANELALEMYSQINKQFDMKSIYNFEVFLCTFKQLMDGKYHVGRPLDSTMAHRFTVEGYFGDFPTTIWEVRKELFNPVFLGEVQGWAGKRLELNEIAKKFNYIWTDVLHDYVRTTDFANPALRVKVVS